MHRPGIDRRVQRTRALLRDALVSLIREKSYDSIVVKEILHRANVGRSTFYTHFRDKDELLLSGIHDMVRSAKQPAYPATARGPDKVLSFSLPVLEYIGRHGHGPGTTEDPGRHSVIHSHLQTELTRLVAEDIRKVRGGRPARESVIADDVLSQYVAATFVLVLNWWMEGGGRRDPAEVDQIFRALVAPTLASRLD